MRNVKRLFLPALLLLAVVLGFQNCGEAQHTDYNVAASVEPDFFGYPYSESTKFFADIQLFKASTAPAGLSEFTFVATVARPDDLGAAVNYQVRLRKLDDTVLCPTQTGTLTGGATRIMFNCVASGAVDNAKLELTVTSGADTQIFDKVY